MIRAGLAATAALTLAACEPAPQAAAQIEVIGSATIEKPAEIFRISGVIAERGEDRIAALRAASDKLDRLSAEIGGLEGLESYRLTSTEATSTIVRPNGCEVGERYYGNQQRPEDCSPIEVVALLNFTVEGAPAAAAGNAIAFLVDAEVETASLLGFDVLDRPAAELEVKQAALADAMSTARALAAQADVEIGRPLNIRYGDEERFRRVVIERSSDDLVSYYQVAGPARAAPSVSLNLLPTPVVFDAEVAVTLAVVEDQHEAAAP